MFTAEGSFPVVITEACIAEPKFAQAPAFDICLKLQNKNDAGQEDWWRGEVSPNYGKGNFASKTQAQITFDSLVKIGFEGGQDVSRITELIGKETTATVKSSESGGKVYYNVKYLGGSDWKPESLAAADANARMQQIMGMAGQTAPAAAPVAAPTVPDAVLPPVAGAPAGNPFGATSAAAPITAANPFG
jgi:hypothetical protein